MINMEFIVLTKKQRRLLLNILDFDISNLRCQYCNTKIKDLNCSIMPSVNTKLNATIICHNTICIATYFCDLER